MHGFQMFGFGVLGGAPMVLMWLIPMLLLVSLIVYLTKSSGTDPTGKTAPDILKERYARGEIRKDEFDQMKRDIGS
jgi:putative membrane protein